MDPATGREIPRSYIVYLEKRVAELEQQVEDNKGLKTIQVKTHQTESTSNTTSNIPTTESNQIEESSTCTPNDQTDFYETNGSADRLKQNHEIINSINNYQSTSNDDDSSRPTTFSGNGISFSKLMFAALHFKDNDNRGKERRASSTTIIKPPIDPTTSLMSSFSKNIALLPPKQQALDFLSLFFAQSNSQLPIFHREEFLKSYFIPIYGKIPESSSFASMYTPIDLSLLPTIEEQDTWYYQYTRLLDAATGANPDMDPFEFSAAVDVPRRFRKALYFVNIVFALASSIWHLQFPGEISENFKNAALLHIEEAYSSLNRLEALQAMLSLTLYSLMRPCVPGVWYLLGSSLRLCVDLGLHNEPSLDNLTNAFTVDMRRRLFWCCYSLDRQICVYLGRPFGIPEESIKVSLPSILDDQFITNDSNMESLYFKAKLDQPSYKTIALTMFKIRRLQAEIQSILYDNREIPRIFSSLESWLTDISYRLDSWKMNVPKTSKLMNCEFTTEFFDLNYYHARMMLYGLSPNRCVLTTKDLLDIYDAARATLNVFYKLHSRGALNYTWAVTQNVFMAQMNFLYSIFNSDVVKNSTTIKEVQKFTSYSNIILKSLIDKCNAAEQCLEVLTILSQAVVKLKYPESFEKLKMDKKDLATSHNMNRLPSEDEVKILQPGGHMTGNMRRLIVSIPELINSEENKQNISKEEIGADRKRMKTESPSINLYKSLDNINTSNSKNESLSINNYENQTLDINGNISLWNMNEFDFEKFMEQVYKADSPDSTRSLSRLPNKCNLNEGNTPIHLRPNIDLYPTGSSISGSSSSQYATSDSNRNPSQHPNQNPNVSNLDFNPIPTHLMKYPTQSQSPNIEYSTHPLTRPNLQPYSTSSNQYSIHPTYDSTLAATYPFAGITSPGRVNPTEADIESPESKKKDNKEGRRVYKLMFETGTESIWDQFFAQPSKLEEF
jgi:hypothetical protein